MLAAVSLRLVLVIALVAGCAAEGQRLPDWTLDIDGGAHDVAVHFPASYGSQLSGSGAYTLRTIVELPPEQRGHALSLTVDCFHGPLALKVNGTRVPAAGDGDVGAWIFEIEPSLTQSGTLALTFQSVVGVQARSFGVAPRLIDHAAGDARARGVARFNRYASIAALCFLLLLGVIYGGLSCSRTASRASPTSASRRSPSNRQRRSLRRRMTAPPIRSRTRSPAS